MIDYEEVKGLPIAAAFKMTVDRINNLNDRVVFLENTITTLVNKIAGSKVKSPNE